MATNVKGHRFPYLHCSICGKDTVHAVRIVEVRGNELFYTSTCLSHGTQVLLFMPHSMEVEKWNDLFSLDSALNGN